MRMLKIIFYCLFFLVTYCMKAEAVAQYVRIGTLVPNFIGKTTNNLDWNLNKFRKKKIVIYFYPKDNTPGCTIESQNFRDLYPKFQAKNTEIIGISRDSILSHENFSKRYQLPFALISDQDGSISQLFGVLKNNHIERSTFLIDENGILQKEWRDVSVIGHANEVLRAVSVS